MLDITPEKHISALREDLLRDIKNFPAGMTKAAYMEAGLHQAITECKGFDLLTMGRGEGPGCYCYLNSLIRKFSDDLAPSYSWIVMDNEAGLEHISRRTSGNIDVLLVVVTENPLSFDTAKNIYSITGEIKNSIRHKCLISSMVRPEKIEIVKKRLSELPFEYVGNVSRDPFIEEAIFTGDGLLTLQESPAYLNIAEIMSHLGGYYANT
jgi:CO dehydrogenase maturation factor